MLKFKKMGTDKVPLLLITANVGSIFEEPETMLPLWVSEFLQFISKMEPRFIALHMQEVGGKTYEKSMQHVQDFVDRIRSSSEMKCFDRARIFLDEDFSTVEKFTALGNMYFMHSSLQDVKIWDFEMKEYVPVLGSEVHTGNIEKVTTKEKAKFPQHFFPECKWSRKGFLRTRWMIRGTAVEFINIHLFHDASNLVAMEGFPSVYSRSRRRALRHTLRHLHTDVNAAPYFIFGDFNFRTDTGGVVKKLTEDLQACRVHNNGKSVDSTKLQYKDSETDRLILTVGKKDFSHSDHQKIFREPWLLRYDRELESLKAHLFEYPIKFPPSYPFEEDVELPTHFMKTRCPSWCDRVLLSQTARLLVQQQTDLQNKHLHNSRKSIVDSDSSGRASSSENSPAKSSEVTKPSPKKQESKGDLMEGLCVPNINVSRKSIADPTSIQQAMSSGRVVESEGNSGASLRRRLVRNVSEGAASGCMALGPRARCLNYGVVGYDACMGDHKPIYLRVQLQTDRGTIIPACMPKSKCSLCKPHSRSMLTLQNPKKIIRLFTEPDLRARTAEISSLLTDEEGYLYNNNYPRRNSYIDDSFNIPQVEVTSAGFASEDSIFQNEVDTSFLHSYSGCREPYTPESVESPSPNPEANSNSDDLSVIIDTDKNELNISKDKSVTPAQLKTKLDLLINSDKKLRKSFLSLGKSTELELLNPECQQSDNLHKCSKRCSLFGSCFQTCSAACDGRNCGNTGCNQCCRVSNCCTS